MKRKNTKQLAIKIVTTLQGSGYSALFAGGWVRDVLLKKPSDDIDIATSAHPEEVQKLFPRSVAVGAAFGVVRVISGKHVFEVATFRSDDQYIDGRRPTSVRLHSSPEEDAKRRDFTINGMFFDPTSKTIIDYVGGQKDLENKILRTIGSPSDRFKEDRLRILRAIRFKNTFHLSVEEKTWKALFHEAPFLLQSVSPERIWQELNKMLQKKILYSCLEDLLTIGLLPLLFPCITNLPPEYVKNRLLCISHYKKLSLSAVLCLLIPPSSRKETALFYRLSHLERTIMNNFTHVEELLSSPQTDVERAKMYALPEIDTILEALSVLKKSPCSFLWYHHEKRKKLLYWIKQAKTKKYLLKGEDFQSLGIPPGKKMGELIEKAFTLSCQHKIKDKKKLLKLLFEAS